LVSISVCTCVSEVALEITCTGTNGLGGTVEADDGVATTTDKQQFVRKVEGDFTNAQTDGGSTDVETAKKLKIVNHGSQKMMETSFL